MTTRTALVTGTSAGLGRAIAIALAREGYDLALTELDVGQLKDTLAQPDIARRKVAPVALDLRSQTSIVAAYDKALSALGDIDLLVNNAGRALVRPAVDVSESEWDDVIDTNLKGAFFLSQLFGRTCIARNRPGAIVSMASTHGIIGIPQRAIYGISKAGLIQMTKALALEWARHGIRVNAIAPGYFPTDLNREFLASDAGDAIRKRIPMRRFGAFADLDGPLLLLASSASAYMTGTVIAVDGGHLVSSL
jgi:NAD(P)-dependent dehydrogenase (short-subunit alcohol dehydrogenase family)